MGLLEKSEIKLSANIHLYLLSLPMAQKFFLSPPLSDPQLLLFLKAFTETEQTKLAMLSGILLANGTLPATILTSLFTDNIVKEGNFLYDLSSYIRFNRRCIL